MIMTQEHEILKAYAQFERMADFVRQTSSEARRIDQVEADRCGRMLELGRQRLAGFVAGHRQGDLGPTREHQGRLLRRLDAPHVRRYVCKVSAKRRLRGPLAG